MIVRLKEQKEDAVKTSQKPYNRFLSTLIGFMALLAASTSSAYPSVNDKALYSGTYTNKTTSTPVSVQVELITYDPSKKLFTQKTITTINGQDSSDVREINSQDMMSPAVIQPILNNCSAHGGTPEILKTGAGTFDTCAMSVESENESGIYWVADVPFGFAKVVTYDKVDGGSTVLMLETFITGVEN